LYVFFTSELLGLDDRDMCGLRIFSSGNFSTVKIRILGCFVLQWLDAWKPPAGAKSQTLTVIRNSG